MAATGARWFRRLGESNRKPRVRLVSRDPVACEASGESFRALVLTNSRQAGRFEKHLPGADPDPWREYRLAADHGMLQLLRDRNPSPWNPFAKRHVFFAGLDPLRALRILCFDRKADIVLCVFENTALFLLLLRRLFRFKPPIAVIEVSPRGWRPRDAVLDWVVPRADLILTVTEAQARYVQSHWAVQSAPVSVGCLIDETFFAPQTEVAGDSGYVLSVGEDFSRDFPTLIEACSTLDCELVLKTSVPVDIPAAMQSRVRIITERLSCADLRRLYSAARVVALPMVPTDNPGGISTLLEAMAMGRPVVASRTHTSSELLIHDESGLLVPPKDPPALRAALAQVLRDSALAARLGAVARRKIEEDGNMGLRQSRLVNHLRRFCAERKLAQSEELRGGRRP